MIASIELQMISKILTTDNEKELDTLLSYDESYYSLFKEQIHFIFDHKDRYNNVPDVFTFLSQFPDFDIIDVSESLDYLESGIKENKQYILLMDTFNKLKEFGSGDTKLAWEYLSRQCDKASELESSNPLNVIKDAQIRADQVAEYAKQERIPTGFPEIDKVMYGGMSTVEELLIILARTNTGKSWVCTKMMESAQANGFPVLFYSPEMQGSYLSTRFDTWRSHFKNSDLFTGKYSDEYLSYIKELPGESTSAYILEDKDASNGEVSVHLLEGLVKKLHIRLLIVDGLSYMYDTEKHANDYEKYKNLCIGLFKLSKKYHCAVVITMQANRETREAKDDKGEPMPTLYNIEGSDHPARICTQAFSLRQIFDKQVLDIRLEKSRNANNQKITFSYAWDVNTGNCQYLPSEAELSVPETTYVNPNIIEGGNVPTESISLTDDDVEF